MAAWRNSSLIVYHGTDNHQVGGLPNRLSPAQLPQSTSFKPLLSACRPLTDFGKGFYTTTSLHQAKQWANARVRRTLSPRGGAQFAVVLGFEANRDTLATLDSLVFVCDTQDYWDLVHYCRTGYLPHNRVNKMKPGYDVVYGPVAIWPSQLIIQNCDQISFHMSNLSTYLMNPKIVACATASGGLF